MGTENYCGGENAAQDKRIEERFRAVERSAEPARERVRAVVAAGAAPAGKAWRRKAAAAGVLCFAAALLVLLLRRHGPAGRELSPDWRADYNFPGYSGQPAVPAEDSPDWRSAYQFPEYRGGRDTSGS